MRGSVGRLASWSVGDCLLIYIVVVFDSNSQFRAKHDFFIRPDPDSFELPL